jgi:hypothetical protein
MAAGGSIQHFNLDTMSGVSPGARTQTFQRIRLRSIQGRAEETVWAQLQWSDQPAACALYLQMAGGHSATTPLLNLVPPFDHWIQRLQESLRQTGWALESCASCAFWQAGTTTTTDGFPAGRCRWAADEDTMISASLAVQSSLALSCPHWQANSEIAANKPEPALGRPVQPMRKIAEISDSKLSLMWRMQRKIARLLRANTPNTDWAEQLVERSGVGAGTEPCFACQGRIANLGALAVETTDGDTQTFSIWRCRICYTLYLNDWIDRWVRLDSLETEERYYRLAPAEAVDLLKMIDTVQDAEHPGRRAERNLEREHVLQFLANRTPLSHQVRQGR